MTTDSRIITITDQALEKLLTIRAGEPDAGDLALVLAITGAKGTEFTYAMHMTPLDQVDADDIVEHHGDLPVAAVHAVAQADILEARHLAEGPAYGCHGVDIIEQARIGTKFLHLPGDVQHYGNRTQRAEHPARPERA